MKIFISEADRQSARRIALKNIARFFNINEWQSKSNDDLIEDIAALKDKDAIAIDKLLKQYFKAYDEWFAFYQKRKPIKNETEAEYNLSSKDQKELDVLIGKRQNALDDLQKKFDELQLIRNTIK